MAFSSTIKEAVLGHRRMKYGTFTGTAVATGDIDTGLTSVECVHATVNSGVGVSAVSVSGGTVTLSFTTGDTGYWSAIGE
jgi:hypothetical protein